jgi:hypothetical protein
MLRHLPVIVGSKPWEVIDSTVVQSILSLHNQGGPVNIPTTLQLLTTIRIIMPVLALTWRKRETLTQKKEPLPTRSKEVPTTLNTQC